MPSKVQKCNNWRNVAQPCDDVPPQRRAGIERDRSVAERAECDDDWNFAEAVVDDLMSGQDGQWVEADLVVELNQRSRFAIAEPRGVADGFELSRALSTVSFSWSSRSARRSGGRDWAQDQQPCRISKPGEEGWQTLGSDGQLGVVDEGQQSRWVQYLDLAIAQSDHVG